MASMQRTDDILYARLTWQDPVTSEERRRLAPLPITLGRAGENTIELNSDAVSRQHAVLEYANGEVVIRDLGSKNGTYVHNLRITRRPLIEGDTFQVGPFRLLLEFGPAIQQQALARQQVFTQAQDEYATVMMPVDVGMNVVETPRQIRVRWTNRATGQTYDITAAPPVTIGRHHENTIQLPARKASRHHAVLTLEGEQIMLNDQGSGNGTFVNGERIQRSIIRPTDTIDIAGFLLAAEPAAAPAAGAAWVSAAPARTPSAAPAIPVPSVPASAAPAQPAPPQVESTLLFNLETGILQPFIPPLVVDESFPPAFFQQPVVPIWQLQRSPIPVSETTYLAIGGGLGSFAWVGRLLIQGVRQNQIVVFGLDPKPHGRYERLCYYSQIPGYERLRSNSDACPDNLWGWPSYALREIWHSLGRGQIGNALKVGWQVFGEPVLTETYTPRAMDVFQAMDREARRIGWGSIWRYGTARAIRKTDDGRYVVAYTQINQRLEVVKQLIVARYVHLAMGYPGIQFLSDLQEYRERTRDFQHVVNAYEDHNHIYEQLLRYGGVVMVRGRGIVASRVIQRLAEVRAKNPRVGILHVMRTPLLAGHREGRVRRKTEHHTELQPFNWPKACWGGVLRNKLEQADDHERDRLLNDWGGTTTASRKDWRRIMDTGLREGWFQQRFGNVKRVERGRDGRVYSLLAAGNPQQQDEWLAADFIIDCTGLEATIDSNVLIKDMIETYQLRRNPKGRLRVTSDFEVLGMSNGPGRVHAAGAMVLGGPYAPVDSFLGLQYEAMRAVDDLVALRAPGLRRLGPLRSIAQWMRWARGVHP
jgi:pSer/pThr/pTyr-binding forkhead associated (FHA) protein